MMAVCPNDGEPLIMTFKYPYKEFICLRCRGLFEFLQPEGREDTPEISARYEQLHRDWVAEQELIKIHEQETGPGGPCRKGWVHVRPCGPTHDEAECACGCTGYDEWCVASLVAGLVEFLHA